MSDSKTHSEPWEREGHVECVVCPACAFTFDACHEDRDGGYSCPVCAQANLEEQLEAAREDAHREHQAVEGWSLKAERLQRERDEYREDLRGMVERYAEVEGQLEAARDALEAMHAQFAGSFPDGESSAVDMARAALGSNPASSPPPRIPNPTKQAIRAPGRVSNQ